LIPLVHDLLGCKCRWKFYAKKLDGSNSTNAREHVGGRPDKVHKAFKLHRDLIVMTNYRLITVDKQGVTGSKRSMTSIPYKSIRKFGKESAGLFDLDAELILWITGESAPIKWEFSKGVNINEVYSLLTYFVLASR